MAKGSHATWGDRDSRECAVCGIKLTLSMTFQAGHEYDQEGRWLRAVSYCGDHIRRDGREARPPPGQLSL